MNRCTMTTLHELVRQAIVLAHGTLRIEALHKMRLVYTREEFTAELVRIVREVAIEYGPTFDDDCAVDQMFDNAELPN